MKYTFAKRLTRSMFLCAAFVILGFVSVSSAQTVTFAQFLENDGSQDYVFTNNGSNANFKTIAGGSEIFFRYSNIVGLDSSLTGFQDAHLTVSTTSTNTSTSLSANTLIQPLDQTVIISIIRDTPTASGVGRGSRRNLLTATITASSGTPGITGTNTGNSGTFNVTTPDHVVTFTSDFISFATTTQRNLALSFSSVSPSLSLGTGSFLQSFTAAGAGTFAANPVPTVVLQPTAASVSISGRLLNSYGQGVGGARVNLIENQGTNTRTVMTNPFGYYNFPDVSVGQTAVLSVNSKRYTFDSQAVFVSEDISGLDLIANQ